MSAQSNTDHLKTEHHESAQSNTDHSKTEHHESAQSHTDHSKTEHHDYSKLLIKLESSYFWIKEKVVLKPLPYSIYALEPVISK